MSSSSPSSTSFYRSLDQTTIKKERREREGKSIGVLFSFFSLVDAGMVGKVE